jgi:hypothetical protein
MADALNAFRTALTARPIEAAVAAMLCWWAIAAAVGSDRFARGVARALPSALVVVAGVSLALYAALAAWYALDPHYFDNAEPTMTAVGWLYHAGRPIYHAADSAERYSHIYGPVAFIAHGLALAWLGPSILSSKLVGVAAGVLSLALLTAAIRRRAATGRAVVIVGLVALVFLCFRNYTFWTRAEPLQILSVTIAVLLATRGRGAAAAVGIGACAAILFGLKLTGPIYCLPIVAIWSSRCRASQLAIAGAVAVASSVWLLVGLPEVSASNYLHWFRLSASTGLQFAIARTNVEWLLLLAAPLFIGRLIEAPDPSGRRVSERRTDIALGIAGLALAVIASKPGSGPYHLLPLLPALAWQMAGIRWTTHSETSIPRIWPVAVTATASVLVLIAITQQMVYIRTMARRSAGRQMQDIVRFAQSHDGAIEMGYGSDDASTLERPVLVFRRSHYLLDAPAIGEHQLAGVALPAATIQAIRACDVRYWLIPKGNEPFSGRNFYVPDGSLRLFPDEFRRAFFDRYRAVGTTEYFDVWECR